MDLIIVGSAFVEIIVQVGLKGHVVSRAISHTLFKHLMWCKSDQQVTVSDPRHCVLPPPPPRGVAEHTQPGTRNARPSYLQPNCFCSFAACLSWKLWPSPVGAGHSAWGVYVDEHACAADHQNHKIGSIDAHRADHSHPVCRDQNLVPLKLVPPLQACSTQDRL